MTRDSKNAVAGSLTGFSVRALTQPLDVLKIRFQLQVESISKCNGGYYQGIAQAIKRIIYEEGVTALWKGHVPGQVLSVLFTSSEFYCFHKASSVSANLLNCEHCLLSDAVAGSCAGIVTTVLCQPIDVLRTRLVGQGQKKLYRGLIHGSQRILLEEGVFAFWRGLAPSLMLIVPQTAISFASYEKFKRLSSAYCSKSPEDSGSPSKPSCLSWLTPLNGALSGCLAKTAVYPLDVTKKRFQVVGFEEARVSFGRLPTTPVVAAVHSASRVASAPAVAALANSNTAAAAVTTRWGLVTLTCLWHLVKEEGFYGLFKGWTPSMLKAGVTTGLTFSFFEFYKAILEARQ